MNIEEIFHLMDCDHAFRKAKTNFDSVHGVLTQQGRRTREQLIVLIYALADSGAIIQEPGEIIQVLDSRLIERAKRLSRAF